MVTEWRVIWVDIEAEYDNDDRAWDEAEARSFAKTNPRLGVQSRTVTAWVDMENPDD